MHGSKESLDRPLRGVLVAAAKYFGFNAIGAEPSRSLVKLALGIHVKRDNS